MAARSYSRGDLVFAKPSDLNDPNLPITTTKPGKTIGMHPVIVLSVDSEGHKITGVMLQTFSNAPTLSKTDLKADVYKWFLPVIPAPKESIHEPISVPSGPGKEGTPQWVRLIESNIPMGDIQNRDRLNTVEDSTVIAIERAIAAAKI